MNFQVQHRENGMLDSERLGLGQMIAKIITENALDYPPGTRANDPKGLVTELLEARGFERIEMINLADDILLIALWRFVNGKLVDEFILEFSGHDVMYVTLFCPDLTAEVE